MKNNQYINNLYTGHIEPDEVVAGCIAIYEDIWPSPDLTIKEVEEECRSYESDINWERAGTFGDGVHQEYRTNYNFSISHYASIGNTVAQNIHNQFYLLLLSTTVPYSNFYQIGDLWHEGYNMLKYSSSQYYKPHSDAGGSLNRTLSAICYLNNDYDGGEIEFVNFNVKIKPEPGMLVLFPSNYAYSHMAHPITSGTKYAIVTWMHSQPI